MVDQTSEKPQPCYATLQVVQEVFKGFLIAFCPASLEQRVDIASRLDAFATAPGLEPEAKNMLTELAEGMAMLAGPNQPRS